jgi:secretion/DNA translocation related TadE-like protein
MSRLNVVRGDRGSASIIVLAGASLILIVALVITLRTSAVLTRHRAESAADLAALAAAAQIGVGADPCAAAVPIANANHGTLVSCGASIDLGGRSGSVLVVVRIAVDLPVVGERSAQASARAGRLPADASRPP